MRINPWNYKKIRSQITRLRAVVSTITVFRLYNFTRVWLGFLFSKLFKSIHVWGLPYSMSIEPANFCNLKCLECPVSLTTIKEKGYFEISLLQKIVQESGKSLMAVQFHFQGEPFLNNNLHKLILEAKKHNLYTSLSTNGHFLSQENAKKIIRSGLDEITISLDGASKESYAFYRVAGSFHTVVNGIKNLVQEKQQTGSSKPYIRIQFLVFRYNEHEMETMKELSKKLDVEALTFKSAQLMHPEKQIGLIPENSKYSRYHIRNEHVERKGRTDTLCKKLWNSFVVGYNGDVLPCCFDKSRSYIMGNLNSNSIIHIWRNFLYTKLRTTVLLKRNAIPMCRNCTEGLNAKL